MELNCISVGAGFSDLAEPQRYDLLLKSAQPLGARDWFRPVERRIGPPRSLRKGREVLIWDRELWRRAVVGGCDRLFSGRVCSWKAQSERSPVSLCWGLWPIMAPRPSSPHSSTMLSAFRFVFSPLTLRSRLSATSLHANSEGQGWNKRDTFCSHSCLLDTAALRGVTRQKMFLSRNRF